MIEHILAVTGTVFLAAQQLDDLWMQTVDSRFEGRPFSSDLMVASTSFLPFSTISSMRAGGSARR
jgi:hypothetical protein